MASLEMTNPVAFRHPTRRLSTPRVRSKARRRLTIALALLTTLVSLALLGRMPT